MAKNGQDDAKYVSCRADFLTRAKWGFSLMQGVFSKTNDIYLFFMVFHRMSPIASYI